MGNINLPELEVANEKRNELESSSESLNDKHSRSSRKNGDSQTADTSDTKVKTDYNWKQQELRDLGIKLNFTNMTDAAEVSKCKIVKLSMEKRINQLDDILSGRHEFLVSDLFEVTGPQFNLCDDVTVTVTLGKHISQRHKVMVKMKNHGTWIKEQAVVQNNHAVFRTKQVEYFVLVGDVETTKVKIPPEGSKVKVDETSKTEVDIPAGAVDADQDMYFQVMVTCGGEPKRGAGRCYMISGLDEESGQISRNRYFVGYVRRDSLGDTMNIENDAKILFGKSYLASLLMFREKENMPTGFPKIWIEIVDKANSDKTVEKRIKHDGLLEIPNSRSPDVVVHDGYRLRIEIDGNLKGISGIPSSHYLMTYLNVADDNHKVFTVETKDNVGSIIGSISFYSDVGNKEWIHAVHVNTVVGFDVVYRSGARFMKPS